MTREEALEAIHNPGGLPEDPGRRQALETWLERDADLRRVAEEQSALFSVLDEWGDPTPSENLDARLRAAIVAEPAPSSWRRWFEPLWRPQWAAAATLALVVGAAGFLANAPTAPIDDPATKTAVALPAADGNYLDAGYQDAEYVDDWDRALDDLDMLTEFDALAPGAFGGKS